MLKHHPDFGPHLIDAFQIVGQLDSVNNDPPGLVFLKPVDTADQRRSA